MATEIAKITEPGAWTGGPQIALSGLRVLACGIGAPICLAQELGTRAGIQAGTAARQEALALQSGGQSFLDDLGENGAELLRAATNPFNAVADVAMWVAIGMIAFAAMVIVAIAALLWKF